MRLIDADALRAEFPEPTDWRDIEQVMFHITGIWAAIDAAPIVQESGKDARWNRLMMHLADMQLAYSPGWGANGQYDTKLYEFVTGLIGELEAWEEDNE